jgi:hypothetical protein
MLGAVRGASWEIRLSHLDSAFSKCSTLSIRPEPNKQRLGRGGVSYL